MKKSVVIGGIVTVFIIIIFGFIAWKFLFVKNAEGETCKSDGECLSGLHCVDNICYSGKQGNPCRNYQDCDNLFCKNSVCSNEPIYQEYFEWIELQKMKFGMPPGDDNIPVPATSFKITDGLNLELLARPGVVGNLYFEITNTETGETKSPYEKFEIYGEMGRGFVIPYTGNYKLKIYFDNELIHIINFEVNE